MELFEAIFTNLMITVAACILPLGIGAVTYLFFPKKKKLLRVCRIVGTVFECLCPILMIYFFFYQRVPIQRMTSVILGLTVSFLGYVAVRYREDFSLIKNLAVNGLGLLSALFKWSFAACILSIQEGAGYAQMFLVWFEHGALLGVFLISFLILLALEFAKHLAKEKL